ncbi:MULTISPECIES: helix-turn-helix domain-containing protein [unclassified Streptomyces]|uniref:GlxA family transcriptional regulator n=1 Tax=unclassified Streptomyces TaxID=2593676 RepID=UPI000DC7EDDB|nr:MULTISPECIES: helix-turn-helix domain-containing protein [unclassified Streptomyces]AWZ10601.1 GlxA family transcriptional regulator [Streptomyces sp. ICC4]AWZ18089.1 GlxA family transcriptional regulator [Streptomyces sp. ICC1]
MHTDRYVPLHPQPKMLLDDWLSHRPEGLRSNLLFTDHGRPVNASRMVPGAPVDPRVVAWLRAHGPGMSRVASVCTGSVLLAEAGLLDGVRATTHWSRAEEMAAAYPKVRVDPEPIFIRHGRIWTAAGITSGIDMALALALVEADHSRELSLAVARQMVVFLRRSHNQSQISAQLQVQIAHRDSLRAVQDWISDHPDADLSVEALAWRAALSPRQFTRAFTQETGMSPGRYVARVRLEMACRRLVNRRHDSMDHIAASCGHPSAEAMRRAFQTALGTAPTEYRDAH